MSFQTESTFNLTGEKKDKKSYFSCLNIDYIAVRKDMQGRGYGQVLLSDCLLKCYEIIKICGNVPMTLIAKEEALESFYEKSNFHKYAQHVSDLSGTKMILLARDLIDAYKAEKSLLMSLQRVNFPKKGLART